MSTITSRHNIGAYVAVATAIPPQAVAANVNGNVVDRMAHNLPLSCVLHQTCGAVTGNPATISAQTKLQDSADGVNFADYVAPGTAGVAQTPAVVAQNVESAVAIDLSSARRFIRPVAQVALTGGNAPTLLIASDLVLGGEPFAPAI